MTIQTYLILFLIIVVVVSFYLVLLWRRRRRRQAALFEVGFDKLPRAQAWDIARGLSIEGVGARSVRYGANAYLLPGKEGDFIVCDLMVSVGIARYSGFSTVTILGFIANHGKTPDFVMRKAAILETGFELGNAYPLKNHWYLWSATGRHAHLEKVLDRVEGFGESAILRKKGVFLSLYFRNRYLNEGEIKRLVSEWIGFCQDFTDINK